MRYGDYLREGMRLLEGAPSRRARDGVFNFTFHGIGEPPGSVRETERAVWVSQAVFRDVLDRVVGETSIRLTFDDGNLSDAQLALPDLMERGLTATFFIVADRIGRPGYLNAADLRHLVEHGMTIGSHGFSHRSWRGLDDGELSRELVTSRRVIEDVAGVAVQLAACPFGAYDRRVVRGLRVAGYHGAFTSDRGGARRSEWLQPRVSLRAWDDATLIDRTLAAGGVQAASHRMKSLVKSWR